eukprot:3814761-Alexandrium_andersonii.AAC.1
MKARPLAYRNVRESDLMSVSATSATGEPFLATQAGLGRAFLAEQGGLKPVGPSRVRWDAKSEAGKLAPAEFTYEA